MCNSCQFENGEHQRTCPKYIDEIPDFLNGMLGLPQDAVAKGLEDLMKLRKKIQTFHTDSLTKS